MSLETSNTIAGLVSTNPTPGDPFNQGDDHLRLIKTVLKAQFPGAGGQGFASPITASETELNYVKGVTSAIQTQLNALSTAIGAKGPFEAGVKMAFYQTFVPVGWTQIPVANNRLSISTSTLAQAGSEGGLHSPFTNPYVASHTHLVNFTSGVEDAGHNHQSANTFNTAAVSPGSGVNAVIGAGQAATGSESNTHHHGVFGNTSDVNAGAVTWQPMYVFCIFCQKS